MSIEVGQRYRSKTIPGVVRVIVGIRTLTARNGEKVKSVFYDIYENGKLDLEESIMSEEDFLRYSELLPTTSTSAERLLKSLKGE